MKGFGGFLFVCLALPVGGFAEVLDVRDAWVEAAPKGAASHVHATLTNATSSTLIVEGLASPSAERTMVMQLRRETSGKMRLDTVRGFMIPPHQTLLIHPETNDVRLLDLKEDLEEGHEVAISLTLNGEGRTLRARILDTIPTLDTKDDSHE